MKEYFDKAVMQNHPLRILENFLKQENANELAQKYDDMRFVGYVLEIGYDTITTITCDPFKVAVGGVPRNSLLIMVPANLDGLPLHFTLLRVLESAPTPLSQEVQQTYFELQKKSMPELDIFTQSELQWGALKTTVLGMFYPHPEKDNAIEFSGDLNNFVSAHKYCVYSPDDDLLNLIVNSMVPNENRFEIGKLRLTECRLPLPDKSLPDVTTYVSTRDFMGARTAMFGKTRLGKSNVVKLIAQSLIETTDLQEAVFEISETTLQALKNANVPDAVVEKLAKRSETVKGQSIYEFQDKVLSVLTLPEQEKYSEVITKHSYIKVGQLIFDINGEYANDNPQDDSRSLASVYPDRCFVYALNPKASTPSEPLKLNFYEQPESSHRIIGSLLAQSDRTSAYIQSFTSVELPSIDGVKQLPPGSDQIRALRKIQMFWAILKKAGYEVDESRLLSKAPTGRVATQFNPGFSADLRNKASNTENPPQLPNTLDGLVREFENINRFRRANLNDECLLTSSGNALFDPDDIALLEFLDPQPGRSGTTLIQPYRMYHHQEAGDFINEILELLDDGQTVILDLGNANEEVRDYFSNELSKAVFNHQNDKFTNNHLGNHFVQLYFEEAHNLFPSKDEPNDTYSRFAKEGAKYHIGTVYSTQSPTTIYADLLAQTENFFVAHLSSQNEVNALARVNVAYESLKDDILRAKTLGYIRMLTQSHRFVISVQARRFTPLVAEEDRIYETKAAPTGDQIAIF
jgi:hypothetical protein